MQTAQHTTAIFGESQRRYLQHLLSQAGWCADGAGPSSNGESRDGQPSSRELFFKTRLCDKFMQFGDCPYGDRCHYAHGPQDRREKGSVAVGLLCLEVKGMLGYVEMFTG